jgi:hypothetical protein
MIETAELAIRLRDWRRRDAEDRWNAPRSDRPQPRRPLLFGEYELGDDDGPETWEGIFA